MDFHIFSCFDRKKGNRPSGPLVLERGFQGRGENRLGTDDNPQVFYFAENGKTASREGSAL